MKIILHSARRTISYNFVLQSSGMNRESCRVGRFGQPSRALQLGKSYSTLLAFYLTTCTRFPFISRLILLPIIRLARSMRFILCTAVYESIIRKIVRSIEGPSKRTFFYVKGGSTSCQMFSRLPRTEVMVIVLR